MMKKLRVLIGCEESQVVCLAFRNLGHEAYSCDLQPCSGGFPQWHIQDDFFLHVDEGWDLIIMHPPCTFLSNAGACNLRRNGVLNLERFHKGLEAKEFFLRCLNVPCEHICVENPVPSAIWELPYASQEIQPYMFGHPFTKRTRLWLRGLPILMATDLVIPQCRFVNDGSAPGPYKSIRSSKIRSKTFSGVGAAMAAQWSDFLCSS